MTSPGATERHADHDHVHGSDCGHPAVSHEGHTDYLHGGHLHHVHDDHVAEHSAGGDPRGCTPDHACGAHESGHAHGAGCGHEAVPHAGHTDYLVSGHLHHAHAGHCDDHGQLQLA